MSDCKVCGLPLSRHLNPCSNMDNKEKLRDILNREIEFWKRKYIGANEGVGIILNNKTESLQKENEELKREIERLARPIPIFCGCYDEKKAHPYAAVPNQELKIGDKVKVEFEGTVKYNDNDNEIGISHPKFPEDKYAIYFEKKYIKKIEG